MRKKIVAGNWKMNKSFHEAEDLLDLLADGLFEKSSDDTEVVVCPPLPFLELASDASYTDDEVVLFEIGAQNCSEFESGAYTGEVSATMLESMGVTYVILGHSERRSYFGETDKVIAKKIDQVLKNGITPIYCCGEVLNERESDRHFDVVRRQVSEALFHLDAEAVSEVVIAYEPVWAIGTGKTATPAQAQEMHAFIRGLIAENYGKQVADDLSILYGGSCNAQNARELFSQPDVDGGLIGGASLKAEDFLKIVNSF
jgi:triosephosphate isomerase (TIM)